MEERMTALESKVEKLLERQWVNRWLLVISVAIGLLRLIWPTAAAHSPAPAPAPATNTNSVEIGSLESPLAVAKAVTPPRDWLTVEEFAQRANVAPRTIISMIADDRISPAPLKDGREWHLAADSRIQPQPAANNRNP